MGILGILLAVEVVLFAVLGPNFLTLANLFEIIRLGAELGLLAIALTPVILTGGIDLSVGSMMALAAVAFGAFWHDMHVPVALAALLAIGAGALGGGANALLITRFRIPPLIVTIGTYSLFRGIAEGWTAGVRSYSGFPEGFLFLGQGYLFGHVPPQALLLGVVALAFAVVVHKTVIGRAFFAIGHSYEGARYAALPVQARLGLVYVLSGICAAMAAILYVAHTGQAKADTGTGYELLAITSVVLGGTSIFGGRGTIGGTLLGLAVIVALQNGLRLATAPAELAGILTGVLLISSIVLDRRSPEEPKYEKTGAYFMKNSQLAVLCLAILAGAGIIAGSNWLLVARLAGTRTVAATGAAAAKRLRIGMMPKAKGDPYFVSCRKGAEEAAAQIGADLIWDGPTDLDPAKQNEVVEGWITLGVDAIAVSVVNKEAVSGVLRKARERGIKVLTWDADALPNARDFFVNQATPEGIGATLMDEAARILKGSGDFAIVTGSLTAANQNEWIENIRRRNREKYPRIHLAVIKPSDDDRDRAFVETQTILKVFPAVKVIMGIAAPAVPGAAEAVRQSGRPDVKVTGLSLPNMCKPYMHSGVIDSFVLWNTRDLGYLTVLASEAAARGALKAGSPSMAAGRLGKVRLDGQKILLGAPFVFTRANVDQFDF